MPKVFHATLLASVFKQIENRNFNVMIFSVTPEELKCQTSRLANNDDCVMVEFELSRQYFEEFRCEQSFIRGIKFEEFRNVLTGSTNLEFIDFSFEEDEDHFDLTIKNENGDPIADVLQVNFVEGDGVDTNPIVFSNQLEMSMRNFKEICDQFKTTEDINIKINVTVNQWRFSVVGNNRKYTRPAMIVATDNSFLNHFSSENEVEFNYRVFSYLISDRHTSDRVLLRISTNDLLVAEFNVINLGYLRYYMCPMIASAEEN